MVQHFLAEMGLEPPEPETEAAKKVNGSAPVPVDDDVRFANNYRDRLLKQSCVFKLSKPGLPKLGRLVTETFFISYANELAQRLGFCKLCFKNQASI
jgi:hypothetical protein